MSKSDLCSCACHRYATALCGSLRDIGELPFPHQAVPGCCPRAHRKDQTVARTSPGEFVRQVQAETKKVVWPTSRETMMTTMMVVLMAVLLAVFFFALDSAFSGIVQFLLGFVAKA